MRVALVETPRRGNLSLRAAAFVAERACRHGCRSSSPEVRRRKKPSFDSVDSSRSARACCRHRRGARIRLHRPRAVRCCRSGRCSAGCAGRAARNSEGRDHSHDSGKRAATASARCGPLSREQSGRQSFFEKSGPAKCARPATAGLLFLEKSTSSPREVKAAGRKASAYRRRWAPRHGNEYANLRKSRALGACTSRQGGYYLQGDRSAPEEDRQASQKSSSWDGLGADAARKLWGA